MKWINLKYQKPEIATAVLVFHPLLGQHVSFFDGAGKFGHPFYDFETLEEEITHWMPLPNDPTEQEKN
jgi:hypothetical protein